MSKKKQPPKPGPKAGELTTEELAKRLFGDEVVSRAKQEVAEKPKESKKPSTREKGK